MSELHSYETNIANEITRRDALKAGALVGAAYKFPWLMETAGQAYDALASPEDIIQEPIVALEPRPDDAPVVQPRTHGERVHITNRYNAGEQGSGLQLDSKTPLRAEHTGTPLLSEKFQPAGVAIITTAEGPTAGEQQYCTLFQGLSQTVAIGYGGGLFMYEPRLGSDRTQSSGEWVRVTTTNEDEPPSPVQTAWVETETPHDMLIEKVVKGTNTLHDLGYRPWAAVLPTSHMPDMVEKELTPATCAQDVSDAINRETDGQFFMVSEKGDIVDLIHMRAKAGETFDLYTQLAHLHVKGDKQPTARVQYSAGTDAPFEFAVAPESLQPSNLPDTTFALMTATSMLMEGVSQRYMAEKIPLADKVRDMGGLSAEDPFSNSLGIVGMLSLIHETGLGPKVAAALRQAEQAKKHQSDETTQGSLEETLRELREKLVDHVVSQTVEDLGVRKQPESVTYQLPRGLSPLIPTKVTAADGATPTHLNVQAAGIRTDNPQVRFQSTKVPAMKSSIRRVLEEVGM